MRSKAADRPSLSINGVAKDGPQQAALPSGGTIYSGLHPVFGQIADLLSHNHWTLTHIPVQTDKEFEI